MQYQVKLHAVKHAAYKYCITTMANVELSIAERELVTNASFILTKNSIVQKVDALLGNLATYYRQQALAANVLPHAVQAIPPKIAKGERYEGLPWLMLDYPRFFGKADTFAIRTFFWWGHYCSITLQLGGQYAAQYQQAISTLQHEEGWYIGVQQQDVWQHHFRANNYQPLQHTQLWLQPLPVIKLAKKIPLQQWDNIESFMQQAFNRMLVFLGTQAVK
jgi:hypothetical protein